MQERLVEVFSARGRKQSVLLSHPCPAALQPLEETAAVTPSAAVQERGLSEEPGSGRGLWSSGPEAGEAPLPPVPAVQSHQA